MSSQHDSTTKYNTSDCIQIWRRTRATLPYYSMFKHHGGYCKTTLRSSAHTHNLHYNSVLAVQSGTHREQETGCPFVHSSVLNFVQAHFGWQVSLQFCFYPLTLTLKAGLFLPLGSLRRSSECLPLHTTLGRGGRGACTSVRSIGWSFEKGTESKGWCGFYGLVAVLNLTGHLDLKAQFGNGLSKVWNLQRVGGGRANG